MRPEVVQNSVGPGLPRTLHPGTRRPVGILRKAPVEFDVQRACRAAPPLPVGDPVILADDLDVVGANIPQFGPSPGGIAAGTSEQRADRSPSGVSVLHRHEAQCAPQPLRVVPVIEQVLRFRISTLVGSELGCDRAITTAATATADQARREQRGDCRSNQRSERHEHFSLHRRLTPTGRARPSICAGLLFKVLLGAE